MSNLKNACVVYVTATQKELPRVQMELEQDGYSVCAVRATADAIRQIRTDSNDIPEAIRKCIENSNLCVFLIPEEEDDDGDIHGAAGLAGQLGRRIVGLVSGSRIVYPKEFDLAGAIIRISSARLTSVIQGEDTWESADKAVIKDRPIDHQKCQ